MLTNSALLLSSFFSSSLSLFISPPLCSPLFSSVLLCSPLFSIASRITRPWWRRQGQRIQTSPSPIPPCPRIQTSPSLIPPCPRLLHTAEQPMKVRTIYLIFTFYSHSHFTFIFTTQKPSHPHSCSLFQPYHGNLSVSIANFPTHCD